MKAPRWARAAVEALGLTRPAYELWMRLKARRTGAPVPVEGPPLPPPYLRILVGSTADERAFADGGRRDMAEFDALFARHGGGVESASRPMEWGCGCGRLTRWLPKGAAERLSAFDINPRLVAWCRANLPGRFTVNALQPPLPAEAGAFDLMWACSVLTHLREETASAWLRELGRVIEPGGRALLTFHDEHVVNAHVVAEVFPRGGYAVWSDKLEGSNYLAAFVTAERLVEMAAPEFEPLEIVPGDRSGCGQAIALFRRR